MCKWCVCHMCHVSLVYGIARRLSILSSHDARQPIHRTALELEGKHNSASIGCHRWDGRSLTQHKRPTAGDLSWHLSMKPTRFLVDVLMRMGEENADILLAHQAIIKRGNSFLQRVQRRLDPVRQVQLAENVAHVGAHCCFGDHQLLGDLGIGQSFRHQT
jgi:hypothetical protein